MPQYPDLQFLNDIAPVLAASQAGRMTFDANEMARQQAVERELANTKASQINPLQVQHQGLVNQEVESRLPSTKANAILDTLKAEQGVANQPRALAEATFNLNTLPEQKKQEFLKRLPQTVSELRMIPPEAQGNYVRGQAIKFGFNPQDLDAYLANTKDLPSALEQLHSRMSLNSPESIRTREANKENRAAMMEQAKYAADAGLLGKLAGIEAQYAKMQKDLDISKQRNELKDRWGFLNQTPPEQRTPEHQREMDDLLRRDLALKQAAMNTTGQEVIGTQSPVEKTDTTISSFNRRSPQDEDSTIKKILGSKYNPNLEYRIDPTTGKIQSREKGK